MRNAFLLLSFGVLLIPATVSASFVSVTLLAVDTESISPAGINYNDNIVRAYNNSPTGVIDGFMKFDLSTIPAGATISGMTLTLFHDGGSLNPVGAPLVTIFRTSDDNWSRSVPFNAYPGLNEALTVPQVGFPTSDSTSVNWGLNMAAFNSSADLANGYLSLAVHDSSPNSYVYFYGSDYFQDAPSLTVAYTVPEPSISALAGIAAVALVLRRRS